MVTAVDVLFGVNVDPLAAEPHQAARLARITDDAGLDLVGVQDHPYQRAFLDTLALLAWLVPQTRTIRFVPDVACLPLRPPAMLAKAAASLDILSGGRIELGLGAGAFWDAIAAMGGPRRTPGEAVEALEEAISITTSWVSSPTSTPRTSRVPSATGWTRSSASRRISG
jgi:alkanesulfonate monooxygenase SsuD/methylene tetrahydromethanopterin reductase-like flavin-dependent oxidoreductase (luciferase family)